MNKPPAYLRVEGLSRRYERGAVSAIDAISFSASAGEVVALTGPSGCGKTTLMSILGLLEVPSSGHFSINGQDFSTIRPAAAFRARHIGFVFQQHYMVPTMTLLENVAAPMIPLGASRSDRERKAAAMLEHVGLSARASFFPAQVSGGERQRAAVARALINTPSMVLADEPTGNLDSRQGQAVFELLATQARMHAALVLLATHNPQLAALAHRRIEMQDGRIISPD